jgi:hypothetical protein
MFYIYPVRMADLMEDKAKTFKEAVYIANQIAHSDKFVTRQDIADNLHIDSLELCPYKNINDSPNPEYVRGYIADVLLELWERRVQLRARQQAEGEYQRVYDQFIDSKYIPKRRCL